VVHPLGVELQQPRGTPVLLRQLAELSNGRYLGQVDGLPDLPFNPARVLRVNWSQDIELWNRWWSLALVVVLLALEWIARRRFGHF